MGKQPVRSSTVSERIGTRSKDTERPRVDRAASDPDADSNAGVRVLCVDDHAVLVEGLKAHFSIDGSIRVVGWLASAEGLLDEVARLKPDVVMLDIEMPGPDVFETADRMRQRFPKLRFVFLSAHVRDGYLSAAYKCGAWGYFTKADDLEDIAAGLRQLARSSSGTFVMGPKVQSHCVSTPRGHPHSSGRDPQQPITPIDALTAREVEVLRLIGRGRSRNEIAKELSRSAKTIDGHQERMMKKLGIESRAELMRLAIREGFAEA